ncbi:MAG: Protein of unknown function precursor [Bacteroidota bacterium]|nr:Protein of unknown function precursor [Bacteroidota bacterium]
MNKILFAFLIFTIISSSAFCQLEYSKWYFGNQAAIDFVPTAPVPLANSAMYATDCPASISDSLGNLLFYSNGQQAWNRNHVIMPNGNGLLGHTSGGQAATIIRKPGSSNLYYLFTMTGFANSDGFRYNLVDMTLNGGLGDIVTGQKNIRLATPTCEAVVPAKDSNGRDAWIIVHPYNTSHFYSYHITSAGIDTTPVISTVGMYRGGSDPDNATGQITIDAAFHHIAYASYLGGSFELFDFNNATGVLSNAMTFTGQVKPWGIEISPDGSKLYLAGWTTQYVSQFDLSTYTQPAIAASVVNVGNVTGPGGPYYTGYMQRAPDGKIYIAVYMDDYLAVINNPNVAGVNCNLVDSGFYLGGATSGAGLPDKVIVTPNGVCSLQAHISGDTTICFGDSVQICAPQGYAGYAWNVGGNNNCIYVHQAGNYYVTITDNNHCLAESNHVAVGFYPNPSVSITVNGDTLRVYENNVQWYLNGSPISGATSQVYIAKDHGIYSVLVIDTNGCRTSSSPINLTGIENIQDKEIALYPNPADKDIIIEIKNYTSPLQYQINSTDGKNVKNGMITTDRMVITIHDLPNGIYVLNLFSSDNAPQGSKRFEITR